MLNQFIEAFGIQHRTVKNNHNVKELTYFITSDY
jgi:hypothetical protein